MAPEASTTPTVAPMIRYVFNLVVSLREMAPLLAVVPGCAEHVGAQDRHDGAQQGDQCVLMNCVVLAPDDQVLGVPDHPGENDDHPTTPAGPVVEVERLLDSFLLARGQLSLVG